ncbi:hypothetical protein ACFL7D_10165, partial [candidate division KSB1 bacterium]
MYRILTSVVILISFYWIFLSVSGSRRPVKAIIKRIFSDSKASFQKILNPRSTGFSDLVNCIRILSSFVALISFNIMTLTGLIPYLISGKPLSGFLL